MLTPWLAPTRPPLPSYLCPQMTCGFSRDDAEAKFLPLYVREGILPADPFEVGAACFCSCQPVGFDPRGCFSPQHPHFHLSCLPVLLCWSRHQPLVLSPEHTLYATGSLNSHLRRSWTPPAWAS